MRCGRPTTDPKSDSIRVRLNDEMRKWLFTKSEREKRSASQIVRDMIAREMEK